MGGFRLFKLIEMVKIKIEKPIELLIAFNIFQKCKNYYNSCATAQNTLDRIWIYEMIQVLDQILYKSLKSKHNRKEIYPMDIGIPDDRLDYFSMVLTKIKHIESTIAIDEGFLNKMIMDCQQYKLIGILDESRS